MKLEKSRSPKEILEIYRPKHSKDILGNRSALEGLRNWLRVWDDVHIYKRIKVKYTKQNPGSKCALLSGPPGIGKTTAAHLISTELGYEVFEFNASDTRSKKLVEEKVGDVLSNSTIKLKQMSLSKSKHDKQYGVKKVIIMDEVDGMSAQDRGGIQQLIKLIKTSKVPVICICNDRSKSSVRSLASYCYDLKFQRPNKNTVRKWLSQIAIEEGIQVNEGTVESLITSGTGDIRQILNSLSFLKISLISNQDTNEKLSLLLKKDSVLTLDHSSATQFIFNESQKPDSYKLRFNAFFVSYDLIPLLIHDHYISAVRNAHRAQTPEFELSSLEALSKASDTMSLGDVYSTQVMVNQNWSLLPTQAALNLGITKQAKGKIGFAGFPQWLGKFSSKRKKQRLLQELEHHLRQFIVGASSKNVIMEFLETLQLYVLKPLIKLGNDGVQLSLEHLNECGLSRNDVVENFQELSFQNSKSPTFDAFDSKIKSSFTRAYNKMTLKSQLLTKEAVVKQRLVKKRSPG